MGGDVAAYDAVVTLMRDLELLLSSFRIKGPAGHRLSPRFLIKPCYSYTQVKLDLTTSSELINHSRDVDDNFENEIESLYAQVSLMYTLLRDSGDSYDRQLVDMIVDVARDAGTYIDSKTSYAVFLGFGDGVKRGKADIKRWNSILHKTDSYANWFEVHEGGSSDYTAKLDGKFVGREEEILQLLDCLTGQPLELTTFVITGTRGIGKTAFTRRLYDHSLVVSHFDVRVWLTLSTSNPMLHKKLYNLLEDKRYLIVLDNMYSQKYWDDLEKYFPVAKNGSRIILTSRFNNVYTHASVRVHAHYLRCLNPRESWELLHSKIFLDKICPRELVHVGEQIANQCQGHPLALIMIGEILYQMEKTPTTWKEVAKRLGSLETEDPLQSGNIVDVTYHHFLEQLKACFLHEGFFLQNYKIQVERRVMGLSLEMPLLKEIQDYRQVLDAAGHDLEDTSHTTSTAGRGCLPLTSQHKHGLILKSTEIANNLFPSQDANLVGYGKEFTTLIDGLIGQPSRLEVFAVSGMCGIGKTTLTRRLFEDPRIVNHFHIRAWITLSQFQLKEVFLGLLSFIRDVTDVRDRSHEELRAEFCEFLKDKRYLIVLDDMRCHDSWGYWGKVFRNDDNGSRIILTSRLKYISNGSLYIHYHRLRRLYPSESWELLSSKIFPNESLPQDFVQIGKEIAKKCLGIPLAIAVMSEVLSNLDKTPTVWKEIANELVIDLRPYEPHCKNLLGQLKACFLNMGDFLENHPIHRAQRKFFDKEPQITFQQIALNMSNINKELRKTHNHRGVLEKADQNVGTLSTKGGKILTDNKRSHSSPYKDAKLVGLEVELVEILDCLTGQPSHLKVLTFTGMAGIGKTTFTRRLYDHPLVVHHFYVHAWITLSQQYELKKVLLVLLSCITNPSDEIHEWSHDELAEQLYKRLKGQRYLIVLDDMWDHKAWDELRRAFPDDDNGSRIILTSRLRDVCIYVSPDIQPHSLRCLTPDESWKLLCSKIFPNESCPLELVPIGKQIANKCQGLPLGLIVVGGLLLEMDTTSTTWAEVLKCVGSLLMDDPQHCLNILALSYNHLTHPLKACFLYTGIFPEDYEIPCKKLIYLWMCEGFIPPRSEKSLEEVAESYLEDLIARSLIMVKRRSSNGRVKICYIHDLMRDFCLRESRKDNFLHIIENGQEHQADLVNLRRIAFHSSIRKYISSKAPISFTRSRSFVCFDLLGPTDLKSCSGMYFKLLRVLDISQIHLSDLPSELSELKHLRYLAVTVRNFVNINVLLNLQSLQTLIAFCDWDGNLPRELWKMFDLRHFYLKGSLLELWSLSTIRPGFSHFFHETSPTVLQNLQTLSTIRPNNCTEKVFLSFPNLKKLGIYETEDYQVFNGWFKNLVYLQELNTLKYIFSNPFVTPSFRERHPSWAVFPPKLMKLTLGGTSLPWEDMAQLSALPNLEVLKLKNYAFTGSVWRPAEDGFTCLKFLLIGSTDLELWEADFCPFPSLQHLVLRHCRSLKEIPSGLGDASLLEKIELHGCGDSAADSVRKLQEEQKDYGNELLTVYVTKGTGRGYRSF